MVFGFMDSVGGGREKFRFWLYFEDEIYKMSDGFYVGKKRNFRRNKE